MLFLFFNTPTGLIFFAHYSDFQEMFFTESRKHY
jgi:hypothetical protein